MSLKITAEIATKIAPLSESQKKILLGQLTPFVSENRRLKIKEVLNQRTLHLSVLLEDIYQPHNISACLRSCEMLGLAKVHIIERKNAYVDNPEVSMGAAKWLQVACHRVAVAEDYEKIFAKLRHSGYKLVTTHLNRPALLPSQLDISQKLVVCFGTEEKGLSKEIASDYNVLLPSFGFTQSYNVSVSLALLMSELKHKLLKSGIDWSLPYSNRLDFTLDYYLKSAPSGLKLLDYFLARL